MTKETSAPPTDAEVAFAAKDLIGAKTRQEFQRSELALFALLCDRNTHRHLVQLRMMRHT